MPRNGILSRNQGGVFFARPPADNRIQGIFKTVLDAPPIVWYIIHAYSAGARFPPSITLSAFHKTRVSGTGLSGVGGYPSGQRGQTVNLLRQLQRFESSSSHLSRQRRRCSKCCTTTLRIFARFLCAHIAHWQSTSLVKKRYWVRFPVWAAPFLQRTPPTGPTRTAKGGGQGRAPDAQG